MPLTFSIENIEMYKDDLDKAWVTHKFEYGEQQDLIPLLKGLVFSGGMIGLGRITYSNAPDWYARLKLCENIYDVYLLQEFDQKTADYVKIPLSAKVIFNHIGLSTNHSEYSQTEWLKNVKKYQKEVDLTIKEMSTNLKHYKDNFVKELYREI